MFQKVEPLVAIASFLTALPEQWKALSALGGVFAAGFAVAVTILGAQVAENADSIAEVRYSMEGVVAEQHEVSAQLDDVVRYQRRINCLLELQITQEQLSPLEMNRRCE